MSVIRRNNWLGQERVDVPDMRSLDSGIAHDFDVLGGKIMAGRRAVVVRGLTIDTTNAFGNSPTALSIVTAGALLLHYGATEAGTMLEIPDAQTADQLIGSNSRVIGSFAASATNYVGIDYLRQADSTTNDQTKFLSANTRQEIAQSVPKGVVLDYRIIISTSPFSLSTNICPIAIINTDGSGNVASIIDARNLMWRLGKGGDVPAPQAGATWSDADRNENPNTYAPPTSSVNPFSGGDKEIHSMKEWMDAVMSVLWEAKSGSHWYSPTTRDGLKLCCTSNVIAGTGDNFDWTAPPAFKWKGLTVAFENSGVYYNTITDNDTVGVTINDGQCLYVDVDRAAVSALVAQVGTLTSLPAPTIPGSRIIIAWRIGSNMFVRDRGFEITRSAPVATTTTAGVVILNAVAGAPSAPKVVSIQANGVITVAATGGNATAITGTGDGTGIGVVGNGGPGANNIGVAGYGQANTGNIGVYGQGALFSGTGVRGVATGGNGIGVSGQGFGSGVGGAFVGGATAAGVNGLGGGTGQTGVIGTGGATSGNGVAGTGTGTGIGVLGTGGVGGASVGVAGQGGNGDGSIGVRGIAGGGSGTLGNTTPTLTSTNGVFGVGRNTGAGVEGAGGGTNGPGGKFTGGAGNSVGVIGNGVGTGVGGDFDGAGDGTGTSDDAIRARQNIRLSGSNPASSTAFTNRLTPLNVPKAWGVIKCDGAGAVTLLDGFNISSIAVFAGVSITVVLSSNFTSDDFVVVGTVGQQHLDFKAYPGQAGFTNQFSIVINRFVTTSFGNPVTGSASNPSSTAADLSFVVFGRQ